MITSRHVRTMLAVTALGAFAAQGALASCKAPQTPGEIPDGRTAEMEEMLSAKRNVEAYAQQVAEYAKCEGNPMKVQVAKARQTKIVDRFNAEVREFKAASSPVKKASYR